MQQRCGFFFVGVLIRFSLLWYWVVKTKKKLLLSPLAFARAINFFFFTGTFKLKCHKKQCQHSRVQELCNSQNLNHIKSGTTVMILTGKIWFTFAYLGIRTPKDLGWIFLHDRSTIDLLVVCAFGQYCIFTARVRSTTGRSCFHRCLSVHTQGVIHQGRYPPPG